MKLSPDIFPPYKFSALEPVFASPSLAVPAPWISLCLTLLAFPLYVGPTVTKKRKTRTREMNKERNTMKDFSCQTGLIHSKKRSVSPCAINPLAPITGGGDCVGNSAIENIPGWGYRVLASVRLSP